MPSAAVPVTLTAAERKTLKKRVRGAKTPCRDRLRAQIVLAAARDHGNARIAADLGISADTARKWRGRFAARGLEGLEDLPRSGRPRKISEADRAAVVAVAWPGTGRRADGAGPGQQADGGVVGAADSGGEPGQAVAVPVLDLPA